MKKINLSISIEDEKLDALVFFMGKEDTTPQKELADALEKLYTEYVPADTRDYIESRMPSAAAKPKRPARPAATKAQPVGTKPGAAADVVPSPAKGGQ
jgi:hypothetical protein